MSDNIKICPYCGFAPPLIYRYKLSDLDISALLKIWHAVVESGENRVNVRNIGLSYSERSRLSQIRFHALIAKVKDDRDKHIPAHWLITKRGSEFLKGQISIPSYIWTQANHVIPREEVYKRTENPKDLKFLKEFVTRADYKILKDFQSSYDILDNKLIKLPVVQMSLI